MKKVARFLLLFFALGAIGYWVWGRFSGQASSAQATSPSETVQHSTAQESSQRAMPVVVVTYFTTNVRCESCRSIETLTRVSIEENFATEMAAGTVRFHTINLDEPANKHFARDYDMSFKTVVVTAETSGEVLRWKKLDEVWSLLNEPEAFKAYVAKPVRSYLNSQS